MEEYTMADKGSDEYEVQALRLRGIEQVLYEKKDLGEIAIEESKNASENEGAKADLEESQREIDAREEKRLNVKSSILRAGKGSDRYIKDKHWRL